MMLTPPNMNMAITIRRIASSLSFVSTFEPIKNPAAAPGNETRDNSTIYRVKIPVTAYMIILKELSIRKIKHTLPLKAARSFDVRST
jgi:hypothetical protein